MGIRRKGREIAVQILYSLDFYEKEYSEILDDIAFGKETKKNKKIFEFVDSILKSSIDNLSEIDKKISQHSTNFPLNKIAELDRCILRVATNEMLYTETPHPIIMDEAIEISKKYCAESSGKFINGILDAISNELKKKTRNEIDCH